MGILVAGVLSYCLGVWDLSQMNNGAGHSAISCRNPPRGCECVYYSLEGSRPPSGRAAGSNSVLETAKEDGMRRTEAAMNVEWLSQSIHGHYGVHL